MHIFSIFQVRLRVFSVHFYIILCHFYPNKHFQELGSITDLNPFLRFYDVMKFEDEEEWIIVWNWRLRWSISLIPGLRNRIELEGFRLILQLCVNFPPRTSSCRCAEWTEWLPAGLESKNRDDGRGSGSSSAFESQGSRRRRSGRRGQEQVVIVRFMVGRRMTEK